MLILLAGGALGLSARHRATGQTERLAQDYNEAMGKVFTNQPWPAFANLVADSNGHTGDMLRAADTAMYQAKNTVAIPTTSTRPR